VRTVLQGFLEYVPLLAILAIIVYVRGRRALQRLAWKRAGHGFPEFAAYFEYSDVPEEVQRRVFEYVQRNWAIEIAEFPVHAEDSIDIYPLDEDQLEDTIFDLAETCGKQKPVMNILQVRPIRSVADLTRLIAHLPTPEEVRIEGIRRLWTDAD